LKPNGNLSASLEDYLEAIHNIALDKQAARAKDIALRLNLKSSSVTGALRSLSEKGLINYAPYDLITLTPEGKSVAEDIVLRHKTIKTFLINVLHIDPAEAEENACKMEHNISPTILDRLISFMKFVEVCPRFENHWVEAFKIFEETGEIQDTCRLCVSNSSEKNEGTVGS
jgi:DtxR family Mn-dependent transcriptional regulator